MNWKVMALSFGTLFLAELGDKTQLAVFTLVTETKAPLMVFIGASLALIAVTFIGAAFGGWVSRYIPAHYLRLGAGLLFVGIGIFVLWQAVSDMIKVS